MTRAARAYAEGNANGVALVLSEPLSFWGGVEVASGRIIDNSHPDRGGLVTGRILVMPGGRGSSSASAVLAETIRCATGPAGIILSIPDPILTVGALVALALYGLRCPIVVCDIGGIATGDELHIEATGRQASVVQRARRS